MSLPNGIEVHCGFTEPIETSAESLWTALQATLDTPHVTENKHQVEHTTGILTVRIPNVNTYSMLDTQCFAGNHDRDERRSGSAYISQKYISIWVYHDYVTSDSRRKYFLHVSGHHGGKPRQ